MSARATVELVAGILVLVIVSLVVSSWVGAREDRVRLAATLEAQTAAQSEIKKQQADLAEQKKQAADEQTRQLAATQQQFQRAVTPEQIAALAQQIMGLKKPITIVMPAATKENPNPQAVAQVAVADAPAAKKYLDDCEICRTNLDATVKQMTFAQQQAELEKKKNESLTVERDAAIKAAKGGSVLQRVGRAAKWLAIGVAIGYAAHR